LYVTHHGAADCKLQSRKAAEFVGELHSKGWEVQSKELAIVDWDWNQKESDDFMQALCSVFITLQRLRLGTGREFSGAEVQRSRGL